MQIKKKKLLAKQPRGEHFTMRKYSTKYIKNQLKAKARFALGSPPHPLPSSSIIDLIFAKEYKRLCQSVRTGISMMSFVSSKQPAVFREQVAFTSFPGQCSNTLWKEHPVATASALLTAWAAHWPEYFSRTLSVSLSARITCMLHDDHSTVCVCEHVTEHKRSVAMG